MTKQSARVKLLERFHRPFRQLPWQKGEKGTVYFSHMLSWGIVYESAET